MSVQTAISVESLMAVLVSTGWVGWLTDDDPGINGGIDVHGPGGPISIKYTKALARTFIGAVVANEQQYALREGSAVAVTEATRSAVAKFADDFCGNSWPRPFPILIRWHTHLPPPPPPDGSVNPEAGDLFTAGLEFYSAAQALQGTELGKTFNAAAVQLVATALT